MFFYSAANLCDLLFDFQFLVTSLKSVLWRQTFHNLYIFCVFQLFIERLIFKNTINLNVNWYSVYFLPMCISNIIEKIGVSIAICGLE